MTEPKRKGARSTREIPAHVLQQLNTGQIESANLVEWLAIDHLKLVEHVLVDFGRTGYFKAIKAAVIALKKRTVNTSNAAIGYELLKASKKHDDEALISKFASHASDSVRCWAAYAIGQDEAFSLEKLFDAIRPFAADEHFGVREIAWLAVRHRIIQDLEKSLAILSEWSQHENKNIRRFASEATRPRGVWCAHIVALKEKPELALALLDPLKSDKSKYVQNSVANWLNDARKTQALWVKNICDEWTRVSDSPETAYIIKRALRSLKS